MKLDLFIGAEFYDIEHKDIRDARNPLESLINQKIMHKEYDIALKEDFGYIMIIMPKDDFNGYPEMAKYSKRTQLADIRLHLDHDQFKHGDILSRQKMIYQGLVRTMDILEQKGLNKTALDELRQDILAVAIEQGWVDDHVS